MSFLKRIKNIISKAFFNKYQADFYFSQAGEDIILRRIFLEKKNGFYIDIGAFHPFTASNTQHFYLNNWSGINIEPRPNSKLIFDKYRPRDKNLELGIGVEQTEMNYYEDPIHPTNNTFSEKIATSFSSPLLNPKKISVWPLSKVLDTYLPKDQTIDFLTCDCEGYDFEVLKSNDWKKYKPTVILVERNFSNDQFEQIDTLLSSVGYSIKYKIPVNEGAESLFYIIESHV
ncbi:methyltransferase, FkbM family [Reichenbachiella faecimaris]|uniref:Methyltransferase, FkbM family n=2 Tax=Reichenbachiella faecimaris TaxID=692418 RepID=A0A1W2GIL0_REIFA|nr:methyltransferase, FkbM family [Reichenbachiella faecimaris]